MGDDEEGHVPPPQIEGTPERPGHQGRENEDEVAGKDVDRGIDAGRGKIARYSAVGESSWST
jgi:hypothetical protein